MIEYQMGAIETRFAEIIWEHEPLTSKSLSERAWELLAWKKSTCYTVLRRLCDKGIFQNVNGMVISCISREEFYARQTEKFIDERFDGSLPAFLAAFTSRKTLTAEEVQQLRQLIASYEET